MDHYSELLEKDDVIAVKKLLDKQIVSTFFFDEKDYFVTPIATAVFHGSIKCVRLLCEHGAADCHPTNAREATLSPLVAAVASDQPSRVKLEIIKLLLNADAVFDWKVLKMDRER